MTRNLIIALALGASMAQAPADDSRPASSNVLNAQYPRVHADNRLTFRLTAPNAQKVQLQPGGADNGLGKGPIDMTRDEKGRLVDHSSAGGPGIPLLLVRRRRPHRQRSRAARRSSAGAGSRAASKSPTRCRLLRPEGRVPHGQVRLRRTTRRSRARGGGPTSTRRPATTPTRSTRYPVLYLQHGAGEDATELDQAGPRELHPRQPDRRRQGQADDRRHGHRVRDPARRDARCRARPGTPDPERLRGCRHHDLIPDDRRQRTARSPTATTGPSPACRWVAGRHCRSRRSNLDLFACDRLVQRAAAQLRREDVHERRPHRSRRRSTRRCGCSGSGRERAKPRSTTPPHNLHKSLDGRRHQARGVRVGRHRRTSGRRGAAASMSSRRNSGAKESWKSDVRSLK